MTADTTSDEPVVPATRFGDITDIDAAYGAMAAFDTSIDLDPGLRELVKLRASALNGCAFCVDMHATQARSDGETERRLATVMVWPHAPFFTAKERAALRLTDAMTLLDGHGDGVSDDVWDEAKAHFDPAELGQLVMAIVAINSWNRIAVTLLATPPLD